MDGPSGSAEQAPLAVPVIPALDLSWLESGANGRWMDSPDEAVRALESIFGGDGPGGAILTGELGDRRETIEAALASVPADRAVFRLHGSAFASATPYGALAILLSGLQEAPPTHSHGLMRVLSEFLCPPGAEPAIVIVSQPDQIDAGTITVLAQLAQIHHITLVVHCERSTDVPIDLAALRRLGTLTGITVWPLTPAASQSLVEEVAGGPVTRFAATVLWQHSGGSIQRLRQLTRDCISSGKLRRSGADWVLDSGPLPRPTSGGDPSAMLRGLPVRQRALLEMLAICGPMRVGDLIHTGYAAELDELEETGALEIRSEHSGRVAQLSAVQSAETMAAIEPDRRRELTATLEMLDPGYLSVLRAAQDFVAIGNSTEAVALFFDHERTPAQPIRAASVMGRMHLAWAETRTRFMVGDLEGAEAVLKNCPERSAAALIVQAAALAAVRGDARRVHALLDSLPEDHLPDPQTDDGAIFTRESIRCRARALRAEALALSDDQAGAIQIVVELDRELAGFRNLGIINDLIGPFERALLAESMLTVLATCGQLDRCRDLAEAVLAGQHGNPYAVQYADLVLAVLEAVSGDQVRAGQRAATAVAQLECLGRPQDLETALAVKAYCADVPDGQQRPLEAGGVDSSRVLESYAQENRSADEVQPLGRLGWMAELLLGWSMGRIHSPKARTARLVALADRAAAEGLRAVELAAVSGAFHFGETWLAPRLAEVAASTQTVASVPHLMLAHSVLEDDPEQLFQALESLAFAGYSGHFEQGDLPLMQGLTAPQLRRLTEVAGAARRSGPEPEEPGGDPVWMFGLTRREKEISRFVVSGKTNAMIARISGISIRTVEGHLYQVYAKLQLKGRADLIRLAAVHTTQRHRQ
ncbi:LuxR C-terminal-related transcriptional regulator [Citricoccus sp. NPDC055426]|uniref:helix-turn-helix transcriptional regulator n=1 Tax=Citricoccus sp. NPDC055426 TaxID=3155536 RepID=UPI003422483A